MTASVDAAGAQQAGDARLYAFRTNLVVSASAGTGKTFRLASLYALLALGLTSMGQKNERTAAPALSPARIAASTFSRAAAAQIRERVERILRAVAADRFDEGMQAYREVLAERARLTGRPGPGAPSMRALAARALADLPLAPIDTLHGLAARVVRDSALELGVAPRSEILDEEAARLSTEAAVEEVLSEALAEGDRAAMDLLDAGGGLAPTRARIADFLDRADEEGVDLAQLESPDHAVGARTLARELRRVCDRLALGKNSLAEPAAAVARILARWEEQGASEEELSQVLVPLFQRRSPSRPSPDEEAFFALRETVSGETHPHRARRLAAFLTAAGELGPRARSMTGMLARIAARRASERQRSGSLGFGDLLRIARDALRRGSERSFDVLLVDEFQDTSRIQRDLVYLLRRRSGRASDHPGIPRAADLEPAGLLLVGDRKQSIYGFRGADVTVFARVAAELVGEEAAAALALGDQFEVGAIPNAGLVTLAENRRSHPDILDFVNWFAAQDFRDNTFPFDIRYTPGEQLRPAVPSAPSTSPDETAAFGARLSRVVIVDEAGEAPSDRAPAARAALPGPLREALVAASLVEEAVRSSSFGALSFRDIAILVRRRSTLPLLELALSRFDVPFVVAGRAFFDTPEVRDAAALLRLIVDPYDRRALATVLRGPALGLSDTSLLLLSRPREGLVGPGEWFGESGTAAQLDPAERGRLAAFHASFEEVRHVGLGLAPADALHYALTRLDLDKVFAALPRSAQRLANLDRLMSFASARGGSLPGFVRWLEQQIADQRDESEAILVSDDDDAVKLLTIHGSKGLEFRAVVLLDMAAAPRAAPLTMALEPERREAPARICYRHVRQGGGTMFTPAATGYAREARARETAERRRLTYVAMTRAREHLFVVLPLAAPAGSSAAVLRAALAATDPPGARIVRAATYLARRSMARSIPLAGGGPPTAPAPDTRSAPRAASLSLATTPLATFAQCPRRYRLIHEMALEAPSARPPLARGGRDGLELSRALGSAAHRFLERWPLARWGAPVPASVVHAALLADGAFPERPATRDMADRLASFVASPYAAHVRSDGAEVYREEPFVIAVASGAGSFRLRGTIDLLVSLADGSGEIIDYKSSLDPAVSEVSFQLQAYALAAFRRYRLLPVRVAAVSLDDAARWPELTVFDEAALLAFESRLAELADRFATARVTDHFAGVEAARCAAMRCGFAPTCHPMSGRPTEDG